METKEIIENNKLIAEFIGFKFYEPEGDVEQLWIDLPESSGLSKGRNYLEWAVRWGEIDHFDQSKYGYHVPSEFHSNWEWLMPVVGKAYQTAMGEFKTVPTKVVFMFDELKRVMLLNEVERAHRVIVRFIKWYNQNKEV